MNKIIIPVLASILILGTLVSGLTPNASAAQGTITFVNPADKHGMITEDGTGDVYQFQIPQDLADSDYEPNVNDKVTFTEGPGQTASDVAKINHPPTIEITSPADEAVVLLGDPTSISGTASDMEDGDLTGSISWTSDRDGSIGNGGTISPTLSGGTHIITASITDSDGVTETDSITINVCPPSCGAPGGGV